MNWTPVIIGATAIAIVLLVGYFVTRWGVFEDDAEDDSGTEQVDRQAERDLERIPLRDKPRQLTLPMKLVLASLLLGCGITSFYLYQFLKSGSPVEFQYIRELQFASVGLIGIAGGVWFKGRAESRIGKLEIDFENTDGTDIDETKTVWFRWSEAEPQDDGTIVVRALFPSLILSVFPRKKLVGHEPRLRGDRPLGKRVAYEVPQHAVETSEGWYIRTQGEIATNGAQPGIVDFRFKTPYELPYKAYIAQREQNRKKTIRMNSLKAELAEAESRLDTMERRLRNQEYAGRKDILSELEELRDLIGPTHEQVSINQRPGGRSRQNGAPQSQEEHHRHAQARANGHGGEGDA